MEHELPKILDGPEEPATVEELEAVVRRAGQRRRASLMAGAAALLVLGAFGGALARGPVDEHPTGLAGGSQEAQASQPSPAAMAGMGMPALDSGDLTTFTSLFRREGNGVAIRAYRVSWTGVPGTKDCAPPNMIHGELSNASAVLHAVAPDLPGDTMAVLGTGAFGQSEGEPVTWAVVRAGAGAATVRVNLGAATDSMAPQNGIAVLTVPGAAKGGVVEALGADGAVVSSSPLTEADHKTDPACMAMPCMESKTHGDGPAPTTIPEQEVKPAEEPPGAPKADPPPILPSGQGTVTEKGGSAYGVECAVGPVPAMTPPPPPTAKYVGVEVRPRSQQPANPPLDGSTGAATATSTTAGQPAPTASASGATTTTSLSPGTPTSAPAP